MRFVERKNIKHWINFDYNFLSLELKMSHFVKKLEHDAKKQNSCDNLNTI